MKKSHSFIELSDYWLSITREDFADRGYGKWILYTEEPHHLFSILKEEFKKGGLGLSGNRGLVFLVPITKKTLPQQGSLSFRGASPTR